MSSNLCGRLHRIFRTTTTQTTTSLLKKATTISKPKKSKPKPATATATLPKAALPTTSKDENPEALVEKFKKQTDKAHFRRRHRNYEAAVRSLAAAGEFSGIEDILEHQKKYDNVTDERFVVRLISLYGQAGMLDHARKLFDEMPQLNCKRTVMSFNALLSACVNSKKYDKIGELLHEIPEKLSITLDVVSYNTVIKAFCDADSPDSALAVIDQMEKDGLKPNLISFNTLLDAFYKKSRLSDADKVWEMMQSDGTVPDVRSYNPKLRALVADKRVSEAVKLIEEMETKGVKPDAFSINALIKGFCRDENLEEAKRWYGELAKNDCGRNKLTNKVTLSLLLPFVCDKGDIDFAFKLCKEAIAQRSLVDAANMQRVVDLLVLGLKGEEAKELVKLGKEINGETNRQETMKRSEDGGSERIHGTVEKMKCKVAGAEQMSSSLCRRVHCLFTTRTTNSPIKTFSAISEPSTSKPNSTTKTTTTISKPKTPKPTSPISSRDKKIRTLVKKFKKDSQNASFRQHNHRSYETTVRRLAAARKFSCVEDILEHQKKFDDFADERFAVRLISLYGKAGMLDHARKLFDEMPQLNCERTVMSFNALLAAHVNCKKFEKIGELLREMREKLSIKLDIVSYNTIIKGFCGAGSVDSAFEVIHKMEKDGLEPNIISFNTLLNAFYSIGRSFDADKLWEMMESKDIVPNVRSYNPKLRALVADKRVLEAARLVEEMESKGVKPDTYSINALIKGFCREGNLEQAKSWYGKMVGDDCGPNKATFVSLIPLACDKGDIDFALELCKKAIARRCLVDMAKFQRVVDQLVLGLKTDEAKELVELGKENNFYRALKLLIVG
ncbi:hypothetical protein RJ640_005455 [Escallonia rubra]|uniref:Pentatricopeptide repeat-containing protein n=1 Tax=Escallonia rubra TaxID=112253 RepID=A0AA88URW5_9ASTE|nr:hypothetical protein RJ640_005455 [Escallonia rubra]